MNRSNLIALTFASCGCFIGEAEANNSERNILLIIADDIGNELLSIYGGGDRYIQPLTPNIDMLAHQGVRFNNFWCSSLSSPTRAMLISGRYGFRTGVVTTSPKMSSSELTLQKQIGESHATGLFGKWHLSPTLDSPRDYGLDYFAGYINGEVRSYTSWASNINGTRAQQSEYAPTQITSWAKEWIAEQQQPWFCWVAYPSAHTPYHKPVGSSLPEYREGSDKFPYLIAMIEAMDSEIGRLLEGVDMANTTVIFISDNGTANDLYQGEGLSKGSMTQGGINTALIIAGAGIERVGCSDDTMVNAVDITPTIVELSGNRSFGGGDGYSIVPLLSDGEWLSPREYNFVDVVSMRRGYMNAISDGRYKLISVKGEAAELYDLDRDPEQKSNLLRLKLDKQAQQALRELEKIIDSFDIDDSILNTQTQARQRSGAGAERNMGMRRR